MYGWSPLWLQNRNSLKQQHWWLQVPSLNDMIVEPIPLSTTGAMQSSSSSSSSRV
jgi:hypothetical protein